MPPEQVAEIRDWLYRARLDEWSAERLLSAEPPIIETALFHSQQLAETAFKAFLTYRGIPFARTHELARLVSLCETTDATFATLMAMANDLSAYAVRFRYPTQVPTPSLEVAQVRLAWARHIQAFVLDRLPPSVRSKR